MAHVLARRRGRTRCAALLALAAATGCAPRRARAVVGGADVDDSGAAQGGAFKFYFAGACALSRAPA